jgi:protein SCO1/2
MNRTGVLHYVSATILVMGLFVSCSSKDTALPILGQIEIVSGDTVYHSIPDFEFIDQDSQIITNATFQGKVYISDFFFTSCPSICPKVKKQMLRMYAKYEDNDNVAILSHSIDTKRDSVPRLNLYASNLGVESDKWHFVTGDKDEIFSIANDYFVSALEDSGAPGGYDHSGRVILVDPKRHIRAFCDGTDPKAVDAFMLDVDKLLAELEK